jgi:hypothetical protein
VRLEERHGLARVGERGLRRRGGAESIHERERARVVVDERVGRRGLTNAIRRGSMLPGGLLGPDPTPVAARWDARYR